MSATFSVYDQQASAYSARAGASRRLGERWRDHEWTTAAWPENWRPQQANCFSTSVRTAA